MWHSEGAAGLSSIELSIWELFLRGGSRQGGNSIWYCVNGMPQKETLDRAAYTCMLVSYRRLSSQFQFSLSGVTLLYLSQWGGQTRRAERGMGVNILEDERNRIALLQWSLYGLIYRPIDWYIDPVYDSLIVLEFANPIFDFFMVR